MADELRAQYPGSATLYTIIRKQSDATVWNGSAFVAWDDSDIDDYDVPLTNQSGDFQTADFPTDIEAGSYSVLYYVQAGGSPAITDLLLPNGHDLTWNGSEAVDESEVSLSTYALTSLESVKTHIGITSSAYDTLLTRLINGVSAEIERICGTAFKARNWRERYNGREQQRLVLKHRPVQTVTRVGYGNAIGMSVTYSGAAIDASVAVYDDPESPAGGGLRLVSIVAAGTETTNNLSFATYPTLSSLATAVNLISGWAATVSRDVRSLELHPTGGEDAKSRSVTLYYPDQRHSLFRVDYNLGAVEFNDYAPGWWWPVDSMSKRSFYRDFQGITVSYRAGYEAIPADVEMVANELVKEAWFARTQNTGLSSYSLGVYSVTLNTDRALKIRERLGHYMDAGGFVGGMA